MKFHSLLFLCFSFIIGFQSVSVNAQCIAGDCVDGRGAFRFADGSRYIGEFEAGRIHGWGSLLHVSGHRYRGTWSGRLPHGEGILQLADGRTWSGVWQFGHPLGLDDEDFLIVVEGRQWPVQTGCLQGDCTNGKGVMLYDDGGSYEGQFKDGMAHGRGFWLYPNGVSLHGQFRIGQPDGDGVLSTENGMSLEGVWDNGSYQLPDQIPFECREGDCQEGSGVAICWSGNGLYNGEFQSGIPDGVGMALFLDGSQYEGEWKDGQAHGEGHMYRKDGTFFSGIWKKGVLQVPGTSAMLARTDYRFSQSYGAESSEGSKGVKERPEVSAPVRISVSGDPDKSVEFLPRHIRAVIVGVADYHHMPALRYTDDDAYRMYAFLKSPEGGALEDDQIRILIDEDATKKGILAAMMDVFHGAGPDDLVLLYFSGHGLEGSFLPFDFDGLRNQLLHEEIQDILSQSSAGFKLCIADACHSGSLVAQKGPGSDGSGFGAPTPTTATLHGGSALLMSSRSNETSLESSGLRQGVFTHYLMRGWKGEADLNGDHAVSLRELYLYLHEEVRRYTNHRQSPIIKGHALDELILTMYR